MQAFRNTSSHVTAHVSLSYPGYILIIYELLEAADILNKIQDGRLDISIDSPMNRKTNERDNIWRCPTIST